MKYKGKKKINFLYSEIEVLYHIFSVKLGISDSESMVMYTLYNSKDECLLTDICKATDKISKL